MWRAVNTPARPTCPPWGGRGRTVRAGAAPWGDKSKAGGRVSTSCDLRPGSVVLPPHLCDSNLQSSGGAGCLGAQGHDGPGGRPGCGGAAGEAGRPLGSTSVSWPRVCLKSTGLCVQATLPPRGWVITAERGPPTPTMVATCSLNPRAASRRKHVCRPLEAEGHEPQTRTHIRDASVCQHVCPLNPGSRPTMCSTAPPTWQMGRLRHQAVSRLASARGRAELKSSRAQVAARGPLWLQRWSLKPTRPVNRPVSPEREFPKGRSGLQMAV